MSSYSKETHQGSNDEEKKQSKSSFSLEMFLRDPVHELRTPLSVLLSSASFLESYYGRLSDAQRLRHVNSIFQSRRTFAEMIQTLQNWSKQEAPLPPGLSSSQSREILKSMEPSSLKLLQILNDMAIQDVGDEKTLMAQLEKLIAAVQKVGRDMDTIQQPSHTGFLQNSDKEDLQSN